MQTVSVAAQKRTHFGKKASADIRKTGMVPAILYSKEGTEHITVSPKEVKSLLYTPDFKLAEISVDGSTFKAIVKEAQFHPVTDDVMHIDFLKLIEDHPILCNVPIVFEGTSPGVKSGGKLVQTLRKVKIKAVPKNITDRLVGDISSLNLGDSLRVKDLNAPDGVEVMNPMATPVALVEVPRSARTGESEEEEEAVAETAETPAESA